MLQIKFHDGETLTWNKVTTTINNLILGKIYVEHAGTMKVQSDATAQEVRIKFKDSGSMFGGSKHVISGRVFDGSRELSSHKCALASCMLKTRLHSSAVASLSVEEGRVQVGRHMGRPGDTGHWQWAQHRVDGSSAGSRSHTVQLDTVCHRAQRADSRA